MTNTDRKNHLIKHIEKKIRLPITVLAFVVITLSAVILYQTYPSVSHGVAFLESISIGTITAISLVLAVVGVSLSYHMSQVVIRVIRDYSNKLERMLGITSDLRDEIYGDILLEKVLDNAMSLTNADSGSILLAENNRLIFKVVKGEHSSRLVGSEIDKGLGIAGWVAESGQIARIADASKDSRFNPQIDSLTGYSTGSILAVPMVSGNETIGVLELLSHKNGHPFRERDEEIMGYLAGQAAISIIKTRFYEDQKNFEIHSIEMLLNAIEFHITEKRGHSKRVARYANIIAKAMNMPDGQRKKLYHACLLHDIGFLKINPEDSFRKEEYIKHPVIGFEMISPIAFYSGMAPIILHHHERVDGLGYPSRLKGDDIPVESKVIAIAEAFDAMTSLTSYKAPMNLDEALTELRLKAGTQFDRELVELFAANIDARHVAV